MLCCSIKNKKKPHQKSKKYTCKNEESNYRFTPVQLAELENKFYILSKNKEFLDRHEFMESLGIFGIDAALNLTNRIFDALDTGGNNQIELQEFIQYLDVLFNGENNEKAEFSFRLIDTKHTGKFAEPDLRDLIRSMMEAQNALTGLKPSEIEKKLKNLSQYIFEKFDLKGKLYVDKIDFIEALEKNPNIMNFFDFIGKGFAESLALSVQNDTMKNYYESLIHIQREIDLMRKSCLKHLDFNQKEEEIIGSRNSEKSLPKNGSYVSVGNSKQKKSLNEPNSLGESDPNLLRFEKISKNFYFNMRASDVEASKNQFFDESPLLPKKKELSLINEVPSPNWRLKPFPMKSTFEDFKEPEKFPATEPRKQSNDQIEENFIDFDSIEFDFNNDKNGEVSQLNFTLTNEIKNELQIDPNLHQNKLQKQEIPSLPLSESIHENGEQDIIFSERDSTHKNRGHLDLKKSSAIINSARFREKSCISNLESKLNDLEKYVISVKDAFFHNVLQNNQPEMDEIEEFRDQMKHNVTKPNYQKRNPVKLQMFLRHNSWDTVLYMMMGIKMASQSLITNFNLNTKDFKLKYYFEIMPRYFFVAAGFIFILIYIIYE